MTLREACGYKILGPKLLILTVTFYVHMILCHKLKFIAHTEESLVFTQNFGQNELQM